MTEDTGSTRRNFLAGAASVGAIAGCLEGDGENPETDNVDQVLEPGNDSNDSPTDEFHGPNDTRNDTKTPEDVKDNSTSEENSTEETSDPVDDSDPEDWEDLTGEEAYINNLPPSDASVTLYSGETKLSELDEMVDHEFNENDKRGSLIEFGEDVLVDKLSQVTQREALNYDEIIALEYLIHQDHDIDDVRVFQDVRRPREGGEYNCTIVWGDDIFWFYPTSITDEYSKFAKELNETEEWNPDNQQGLDLDYQELRTTVNQDYDGNWGFDKSTDSFIKRIDGIAESLSYQNDGGWLYPTEEFHRLTGAVHHMAGNNDVEIEGYDIDDSTFDTSDVVELRDEVNDLKQEYEQKMGENSRLVLDADYQDGELVVEAEVTDEIDFSEGYADRIIA